jgi:hypothetical protein
MTKSINMNRIDSNILALVLDHRYTEAGAAMRDLNPDASNDSLLDSMSSLLSIAPNPL